MWVLLPTGRANHPLAMLAAYVVVAAGLDADHVDVGGDRHRDCPGLFHQVTAIGVFHQVTAIGDVSLHAPHLIYIRSENSLL